MTDVKGGYVAPHYQLTVTPVGGTLLRNILSDVLDVNRKEAETFRLSELEIELLEAVCARLERPAADDDDDPRAGGTLAPV